jgi:8-amino-7-oxononanoate synthase
MDMQLEPLAIIGIGCRFPGANNPEAFWQLVKNGVEAISEVPPSRWNLDRYYDPDATKPDKMNTRRGGFLEEIDRFDPQFFGIAPREAATMDPQQRLLLEVAWETLEDGGQIPDKLRGSKTGVFIGIGTHDYSILLWQQPVNEPYATTGTGNCIAANRLSYVFDFKGPSLAVDTACSSSLVALHLACQSIWAGESDLALAGGVNMLLLPTIMVGFTKGGFLASDGRCKSFDASADGYVRGEGAGLVLLKPLSRALQDGDDIYSVIRSSAVNQDGCSNGLAAPNLQAQEAVLREAYQRAEIDPTLVDYIEAHGTGTAIGDPIEMNALGAVLGKNRAAGNYCAVASVKTNIGHTETAAGIAGVIKTALILKYGQIPPSLNFDRPNPKIDFEGLHLKVNTELTSLPENKIAIAGVNSFGFGGTNAHVVMQAVARDGNKSVKDKLPSYLLTLSAKNKTALQELAQNYGNYNFYPDNLGDICFTANTKRSQFNHRLTCVSNSLSQLQAQLKAFSLGEASEGLIYSNLLDRTIPEITFLFTGQGSQYLGMGKQLYETQPLFRQWLDRCAEILQSYLDRSLLEIIGEKETELNRTQYTQPALFAIEYALAQLWLSWGIKPSRVMGHSIGEYVAACVAGVFSLEDGLKLVATRGKLMQQLPAGGGMLAVFASEEKLLEVITGYPEVAVAAVNSQQNVVISGKNEILEGVKIKLTALNINSQPLQVSHAFHSPLMQPMLEEFREVAAQINYSLPKIPLVSNVTGKIVDAEIATADYWVNHIIKPVQFARSFEFVCLKDKTGIFLEIGAKPTLSSIGETILTQAKFNSIQPLLLSSLSAKKADWEVLLSSLARLYHCGIAIDWDKIYLNYQPNIKLPTYPFQRQRYWWETKSTISIDLPDSIHPLLGAPLSLADSNSIYFQTKISPDYPAYLQDHCLQETPVLPATAFIEMALLALEEKGKGLQLNRFTIEQPLVLKNDGVEVQVVLIPEGASYKIQIFSRNGDNFILHCEVVGSSLNPPSKEFGSPLAHGSRYNGGNLRNALSPLDKDFRSPLAPLSKGGNQLQPYPETIDNYYRELKKLGLNYGKNFQGIQQIWAGNNRALAYIKLPENLVDRTKDKLHPALLDACFQLFGVAFKSDRGLYLPVSLDSLSLYQTDCNSVWAYIQIEENNGQIKADLQLFNDNEEIVADIQGLSLQYLNLQSLDKLIAAPAVKEDLNSWLYEVVWEVAEVGAQGLRPEEVEDKKNGEKIGAGNWLIFADEGELGTKLAEKLNRLNLENNCVLVFPGHEFAVTNNNYYINPTHPDDFKQLLNQLHREYDETNWGIIHLWNLNDLDLEETQTQTCASILHLIQALDSNSWLQVSRLGLITAGKELNSAAGLVWGLSRTILLEYPDLKLFTLDLDNNDRSIEPILQELADNNLETQIAYHNQQRYVARLARQQLSSPDISTRLQLSEYGTLDNLSLAPLSRRQPQPGEVEIQVIAAGVNFRDVLNALGVLKFYAEKMGFTDATQVPFGGECAGVIVNVGEGVTDLQIGDNVIAAQAMGSIASFVTVNSNFVVKKPENLSFTEAATIPTTFLTAYYGLNYLAKIKKCDRILIHAAAGGVGLAAIQLAQQAGAEIFATASPGKHDFLKSLGIKYVFNSRNLDFAEEIMDITQGKGVDLILNSLNGDFIPKNLEILATNGKFIEIGKLGIWDEGQIKATRNDIDYYPFDLLEVSTTNPSLINNLFSQLKTQFDRSILKSLPHQVWQIDRATDAFRYMAQAKHIGKVVIKVTSCMLQDTILNDGSYLITGGFGALGLQVANWLVEKGAKYLILLGRSQPTEAARVDIEELKKSATIQLETIDLTDLSQLQTIITNLSLPLKGVIHAAGILDDGLLKNLSWQRFQSVLQPKVNGAWALHLATQNLQLDWFVCFSSVVSVLGSAGQANYSAANGFMDSLMHYRRNSGLPGTSINWSIWADDGMAQQLNDKLQERLSQQGLTAIAPDNGLEILEKLLLEDKTQSIVFPVNWSDFLSYLPSANNNPFFQQFYSNNISPTQTSSFLQQLANTPKSDRYSIIQQHIQEKAAKVLGFNHPEDVDLQETFADLGMDSLMAVEFENSLKSSFGNQISLSLTFDYPTIELLSEYIDRELLTDVGAITNVGTIHELSPQKTQREEKTETKPEIISNIEIPESYYQFQLTPEYISLKQDLARVEKLGNPFFTLHQNTARDTIQTGDRELINYSSYNYIGMSGEPVVVKSARDAIELYGTSVSASRLLSGERPLHRELEQAIANLIGTEDSIVYVGGHATNVTTIGHLFKPEDLIICDALSHNSVKEGCKLSGADIIEFPHNDWQALKQILAKQRHKYQKVLIAIEGIYSTDGDIAPLPEIVQLKHHYKTFLLVDEAHSIGVLGKSGGGIREHFNLQPTDVDLWMGTLSKSFASCGGYIAGNKELIEYLKYTSPGFIFSVGMSPANTAAALAAIQLLNTQPQRAIKLQARSQFCLNLAQSYGFNTGFSHNSPVIPIIVGEPNKAVRLSQLLEQQGINIKPMVYPSVPYDAARLRLFITCLHSEEQIEFTLQQIDRGVRTID